MFYRLKDNVKRAYFNIQCKGIFSTPPINSKKDKLLIVTLVSHRDLTMNLIALKSLYHFINRGEIAVINDGTLTLKDIDILRYHISQARIIDANDIKAAKYEGKTTVWERLFYILDNINDYYIIELDSDTVTVADVPEVIRCIEAGSSFILGASKPLSQIEPMRKVCEMMKNNECPQVQIVAEKNFFKLKDYDRLKYVRGCAALAGYKKGSFSSRTLENFFIEMERIVGLSKWSEWGSEQVMVNYVIANTSPAEVLPYPKYATYYSTDKVAYEDSSFLHFIGTSRFDKGFYVKMAKKIIEKM